MVLGRWSSWGAIPDVFDTTRPDWTAEQATLRDLLTDAEWDAAARTTINAHYTAPAIAAEIWRALSGLGVAEGRVLEPGCGSGTFIGLAPNTVAMTGVELDPVTASITGLLYPDAVVRAESFADTRLPAGTFDAVIGNVPFSDVALHDPVHNPGRHSLHNHFIIKALHLTRPGGIAAVLTSRYTLDSQNPAARREIADLADLVGAMRLPTGTHRRIAGTDAVTDLLILRRRNSGEPPAGDGWDTVTPVMVDGKTVRLNRYFATHPDRVLGTLGLRSGMHGDDTLTVTGDLDRLPTDLRDTLDTVIRDARRDGLSLAARSADGMTATPELPVVVAEGAWDGSILPVGDGTFRRVVAGIPTPLQVPRTAVRELTALLHLRDGAVGLLRLESTTLDDTTEITEARGARGEVVVEVTAPDDVDEIVEVCFAENGRPVGPSFAWAAVGRPALSRYAHDAGYAVGDAWTSGGRTFLVLTR